MTTETKSGYDIDNKLLEMIDNTPLNERLKGLKERYLDTTPRLASERGTYYAQSWRETEGQPIQLRIARAVKKVLENIPTPIFDNELVVGSITKYFRKVMTGRTVICECRKSDWILMRYWLIG